MEKVVATEKVTCKRYAEEYEAVVIIFEDGSSEVRCAGNCLDCPYRGVS